MSKLDVALEVIINLMTEGLVVFLIAQYNYYLAAAYGLKFLYAWFSEIRAIQMEREMAEIFEAEAAEERAESEEE